MNKKKDAKVIANIAWLGKPNGTISPERCQTLLFGHGWLEHALPESLPNVSAMAYLLVGEYSARSAGEIYFQGKIIAISACLTLQEELTITSQISENGHDQALLQAKILDWKLWLEKNYSD